MEGTISRRATVVARRLMGLPLPQHTRHHHQVVGHAPTRRMRVHEASEISNNFWRLQSGSSVRPL